MTRFVPLRELAAQVRGVTYKATEASTTPQAGTIGVARAGNIADGELTVENLVYVPASRVAEKQWLKEGDVLVAASSGSLDVVGKAARIRRDEEVAFGAFCKVLRPTSEVDAGYFAHFFQTAPYRRHVARVAAGSNINNLKGDDLDNIQLWLPPIGEQRRIAATLDAAESLWAKRRRALDLLGRLRTSVVLEHLATLSEREPLGSHLAFVTSGSRGWAKYYSESGSRFVRSQDVLLGEFVDCEPAYVKPPANSESKRTRISADDLLITITGVVGKVAVAPSSLDGAFVSQHVAIARLSDTLRPRFAEAYLCSDEGQRQLERVQYGQTKPGLNLSQIRELTVPVPSTARQVALLQDLDRLTKHRFAGRDSATKLKTLVASLQQRAFRGEL